MESSKYRFIKKLTNSASSGVYLAESTGSFYAVKEIRPESNESQLLASLSHPNIIKYVDKYSTPEGKQFMVTEYCREGDLAEGQSRGLKFTYPEIKEIIVQIMLALKYLHDQGIIHRDIKLKNIFISSRLSGIVRVKLGDFGIAKALSQFQLATTMVGTPYYLSPELCSRIPYDKSVDIWSFGCVIYELLTDGHHPFNAKSFEDLVGRIQKTCIDYSLIAQGDARVVEMLKRMLCKNPKDRLTIDDMLCLPLIQEFIQDFVAKINATRVVPPEVFSPSVTLKSDRSIDWMQLSSTAELLNTVQTFLNPSNQLKSKFQAQITQAVKCYRYIDGLDPVKLKAESEKILRRLQRVLILPSRINSFIDAVKSSNFEMIQDLIGKDDEKTLKEFIEDGLIGDLFVLQDHL